MKYLILICAILCANSIAFSKDYNILSFGAVADAKTLNTKAIQAAINKANEEGGGRVVIPEGRFLSGTTFLKSNVELHLSQGAVLLGSVNPSDYEKIQWWPKFEWGALIIAKDAKNISISGRGTIDGQGAQLALNVDSLFYAGEIDSNKYNFVEKRPKEQMRPQILMVFQCRNVSVKGVSIKNASCWVQTYTLCENVIIDSIDVYSDAYWNNDGIDILDSKNVRISNCKINSADDGISLKSYQKYQDGTHFCDSIYISNCSIRSSASAIKFGTASLVGFKNVVIKNIKVFDTFRSAIALEMIHGGVLENVLVDGIEATNTGNAIFIRIGQQKEKVPPGKLRNVTIKNIKVEVPFERMDYDYEIRGPELPFFHNVFPSSITGLKGALVEKVKLENIEIIYPGRGNRAYANLPLSRLDLVPENANHYPEFSMFGELPAWGFYIRHVDGLSMNNIKLKIKKADYRPAIVLDDVKNSVIQSLEIVGDEKRNSIIQHQVENVEIK